MQTQRQLASQRSLLHVLAQSTLRTRSLVHVNDTLGCRLIKQLAQRSQLLTCGIELLRINARLQLANRSLDLRLRSAIPSTTLERLAKTLFGTLNVWHVTNSSDFQFNIALALPQRDFPDGSHQAGPIYCQPLPILSSPFLSHHPKKYRLDPPRSPTPSNTPSNPLQPLPPALSPKHTPIAPPRRKETSANQPLLDFF